MFAIYDQKHDEYYTETFHSKDDALDQLQELCYQNEWDFDWFAVVKFAESN